MGIEVRKKMLNADKYSLKCPYIMTPIGVCIHNTANDAPAINEISYMISNNSSTSFHYAIDDKEVVQGLPLNRNAFHAGDGGNGTGNRKYIAIEICYSLSGGSRFDKAEVLAAKFTAQLLKEKKWGIKNVKKHQDFSNKYCPHRTLDRGWDRFLKMIQSELDKLNKVDIQTKPTTQPQTQTKPMLQATEKIYHTLEDVPSYAKDTIYKLVKKGYLRGGENGDLKLSEDMVRLMVINDRAGLYN